MGYGDDHDFYDFDEPNEDDASDDPYEVRHVRALRRAGKALVIVVARPGRAAPTRDDEVMIPTSQIDPKSAVKNPGDTGTLVIPKWLADDRDLQ